MGEVLQVVTAYGGLWDSLCNAAEEHFATGQNLLWGRASKGKSQRQGTGKSEGSEGRERSRGSRSSEKEQVWSEKEG